MRRHSLRCPSASLWACCYTSSRDGCSSPLSSRSPRTSCICDAHCTRTAAHNRTGATLSPPRPSRMAAATPASSHALAARCSAAQCGCRSAALRVPAPRLLPARAAAPARAGLFDGLFGKPAAKPATPAKPGMKPISGSCKACQNRGGITCKGASPAPCCRTLLAERIPQDARARGRIRKTGIRSSASSATTARRAWVEHASLRNTPCLTAPPRAPQGLRARQVHLVRAGWPRPHARADGRALEPKLLRATLSGHVTRGRERAVRASTRSHGRKAVSTRAARRLAPHVGSAAPRLRRTERARRARSCARRSRRARPAPPGTARPCR